MKSAMEANTNQEPVILNEQITVLDSENTVPKSHIQKMVRKVAGILAAQGVPCCECRQSLYKLYRLYDCGEDIYRYSLKISCAEGAAVCCQFQRNIQAILEDLPNAPSWQSEAVQHTNQQNQGGKSHE